MCRTTWHGVLCVVGSMLIPTTPMPGLPSCGGSAPSLEPMIRYARHGSPSLVNCWQATPGTLTPAKWLVTALADAGEPEAAQKLLEAWPLEQRDGRYWRLRGRLDLEHDRHPDQAVAASARRCRFPQDWRIHYRLARALQIVNRPEEARREAETVSRIRELLDPLTLGPKLDAAFSHLDQPAAFQTLADLCDRAGLTRLAASWRTAGTTDSL